MKFDIKDVKSWANRYDVKVGDKGYFGYDIRTLHERKDTNLVRVDRIYDDKANCFLAEDYPSGYPFFLPSNAVEKEYRSFEDLYEFYRFISFGCFVAREDFTQNMLLKMGFTYREKSLPQIATSVVITRIDVGLDNDPYPICINNKDFEDWFDNYEIMNSKGEWQPFGVEIE